VLAPASPGIYSRVAYLSGRGHVGRKPLEARVAVLADDDVIVCGDPERTAPATIFWVI
jgi:hypothetical protein